MTFWHFLSHTFLADLRDLSYVRPKLIKGKIIKDAWYLSLYPSKKYQKGRIEEGEGRGRVVTTVVLFSSNLQDIFIEIMTIRTECTSFEFLNDFPHLRAGVLPISK